MGKTVYTKSYEDMGQITSKLHIKRGEIYYVRQGPNSVYGTETQKSRPAVVISADKIIEHGYNGAIVVLLTTKPKNYSDAHCTIHSSGCPATVLTEQMKYVDVSKFGEYVGTVTDEEMEQIEECLLYTLGINVKKDEELMKKLKEKANNIEAENKLLKIQIETYKSMIKDMLKS